MLRSRLLISMLFVAVGLALSLLKPLAGRADDASPPPADPTPTTDSNPVVPPLPVVTKRKRRVIRTTQSHLDVRRAGRRLREAVPRHPLRLRRQLTPVGLRLLRLCSLRLCPLRPQARALELRTVRPRPPRQPVCAPPGRSRLLRRPRTCRHLHRQGTVHPRSAHGYARERPRRSPAGTGRASTAHADSARRSSVHDAARCVAATRCSSSRCRSRIGGCRRALPRRDARPFVSGVAAAAIALLARVVGGATEQLGGHVGSSAAGVVQSALGNLPELFIALFALTPARPRGAGGTRRLRDRERRARARTRVSRRRHAQRPAALRVVARPDDRDAHDARSRDPVAPDDRAHVSHVRAAHGRTLSLICAGVLLVLFFATLPVIPRGGDGDKP